jgi:hypothetical protein
MVYRKEDFLPFDKGHSDLLTQLGSYPDNINGKDLMLLSLERLGFEPEAKVLRRIMESKSNLLTELDVEFRLVSRNKSEVVELAMDFGTNCIGCTDLEIIEWAKNTARQRQNERMQSRGWA